MANNAFDGYLSLDRQGLDRVPCSTVLLTAATEYYFIVPGDLSYAIVPSFQDWEFPRRRIPDSFPSPQDVLSRQPRRRRQRQQPSNNDEGTENDRDSDSDNNLSTRPVDSLSRCAVTNSAYSCQKAHLIPKAHQAWYDKNAIVNILHGGHRLLGIDAPGNLCHLRFDIYNAFDKSIFALVYKEPGEWVVHVLQALENGAWDEFAHEYHNLRVPARRIAHLGRESLFARFALNVFLLVKPFLLTSPVKRRVARLVVDPDIGGFITKITELSSYELKDQYGGSSSKGASPTKKKRPTTDESPAPLQRSKDDDHNVYDKDNKNELESPSFVSLIQDQDLPSPPLLSPPHHTEENAEVDQVLVGDHDPDSWYRDREEDWCQQQDTWYLENVVKRTACEEEEERGRPRKRFRETDPYPDDDDNNDIISRSLGDKDNKDNTDDGHRDAKRHRPTLLSASSSLRRSFVCRY